MRASIIIPTYNGSRKIVGLLNALKVQDVSKIEIIVVVDGSTDDTENVLQSYQSAFPNFIVIKQENLGRSMARNNGARNASSDLFIFYDDDMLPAEDSISRHCKFHSETVGILCGDPVEKFDSAKTDIQNYKAWLTQKWTERYNEGMTQMNQGILFFTASNCSVRKNVFWQLNGFNVELTDAEDYEFAYRALRSGLSVFYDRDNKAVHNESITCRSYIIRARQYAEAQKGLLLLGIRKENEIRVESLKKIVYMAFAFPFWVRWIDRGLFVRIVPRGIRYQLYSIIIHALSKVKPGVGL